MKLFLENVRSFCGRYTVPVRPLTLLVGENSTGKSTFLAMLAHVSDPNFPSLRPSFNTGPFQLGTYDSIATYKGGRFGRAHAFSVGTIDTRGRKYGSAVATYTSYRGQPQLCKLEVTVKDRKVQVNIDPNTLNAKFLIEAVGSPPLVMRLSLKGMAEAWIEAPFAYLVRNALYHKRDRKISRRALELADTTLMEMYRSARSGARPTVALAPVRTRPKRTYDVISDEFTPEGDHIPVVLARILQGEDPALKIRLIEALTQFGKESSLFTGINVKSLGKRPSDPFQILISTTGPAANLLDVGYGVSQALPVVVQSILAQRSASIQLLFQQPEVHLHPRGQAALGSFFARLITRGKMHAVVETHSDYLLDRVRQEVARGSISRRDVLVLFFEKKGIETSVYQIGLDKKGNVLEAPRSYRQFFLQEELNLMSRAARK